MLSLLESWAPDSSLTTFKLAWKTATLLALVTVKHCSDLTLLCIDNQQLFLQCHAAIFIPLSRGKTDHPGHLPPPQICIESHSNINLCPVFYLKAYVKHTEPFRKKSDGLHVTSLFMGKNRQHRPVCAKTISSWVRKVLCVAKAHTSPGFLSGGVQPQQLVFSWCLSCRQGTGLEFLHWLGTIFYLTLLLWIGTRTLYSMLCWASVSRFFLGKYQILSYIQSCVCWAVEP